MTIEDALLRAIEEIPPYEFDWASDNPDIQGLLSKRVADRVCQLADPDEVAKFFAAFEVPRG